jgi:hypothetical protein
MARRSLAFPARAGMVPTGRSSSSDSCRDLHASGDDPGQQATVDYQGKRLSARAGVIQRCDVWGTERAGALPARAGMARASSWTARRTSNASRAGGNDPIFMMVS